MEALLRAQGLSKSFLLHIRGEAVIEAFEGLDFHVDEGEFLGVSGPSGIGKSTLLKTIYRTYRPDGGVLAYRTAAGTVEDLVQADEHRVLELRHAEISYVSQFFHVMPRVSALDLLVSSLGGRGLTETEAMERSTFMLERLRLPRRLWDLYPSTFSGGEKQRLNVAHALVSRPRLLLLDEPTASLDAATRDIILDLLMEMKDSGTTMIGVFHDMESMRRLADRELRFRPGSAMAPLASEAALFTPQEAEA